jgi:membrane protein DedA with SNARE-associated domain
MITWLESVLYPYALTIPIELLIFFFSILEEIIPPIPAFPVMIMAGSFSQMQGYLLPTILWLALVAAVGKTIGAVIIYRVVDKMEDVFVQKFGNYFDLTPGALENFGKRISRGKYDYVFLTVARAIPFIPSTILTVGGGLLKIPLQVYVISTFIGTFIRDCFYLYAGYFGAEAFVIYLKNSETIGKYIEWPIIIGVICLLLYLFIRKRAKKVS